MVRYRTGLAFASTLLAFSLASISAAQDRRPVAALDPDGIARLQSETGGAARISVHPATGAARFVRISPETKRSLSPMSAASRPEQKSADFFRRHGGIFGIEAPEVELDLQKISGDPQGGSHLTYRQVYFGVPVFGAELKSHFDADGRLTAVNGTFVPRIVLDTAPSMTELAARKAAIAHVESQLEASAALTVRGSTLYVYRTGLAQGVPGDNRLVWEVEVVGDAGAVREFVYIDAHTGKLVDQITGVYDAMSRRAYNGNFLPQSQVPTFYPGSPYWVEGDPFPTAQPEANNMLISSQETYDLFNLSFGHASFDDADAVMDSIFHRGYGCVNASWNGTFISFCRGVTTDDVTAHEWGHAYTQYTHNLIYAWQPGALNESYSDIWGETVDLLNGTGADSPGGARSAGVCSTFNFWPAVVRVNSPGPVTNYSAGRGLFGPILTSTGVTAGVVLADDGSGVATDGCQPLVNGAAVSGNIAFIDRGTCSFRLKVQNAQAAGAIGVIIANNLGTQPLINMGDDFALSTPITIPSELILKASGDAIRAQFGVGVNATLRQVPPAGTEDSYRWLVSEDAIGFGGPIRDMWTPGCAGDPGKVSDTTYFCGTGDGGGVHTNSGVPNHGYALLVDGGTYNGQTIAALGLTKAAHIYYRAMATYQVNTSDFADHADALEQSCADLVGVNLADLSTGGPSGQMLTASDCAQVEKATLAVELRTPPAQCNFQPLLAKNPPAQCAVRTFYVADFESGEQGWTASHIEVTPADFTDREWQRVSSLPDGRAGSAFFAIDPDIGTCAPGGDESGVLQLTSPAIAVPAGLSTPILTFDHYIASEFRWDGGNVKISVDGGAWTLIPAADYTYNPYNTTLQTVAAGNTNPMASEAAFSGSDGGSVEGSWGQSQIRLSSSLAGHSIRLRLDFGTDGCGAGLYGWFVDDVKFYDRNFSTTVVIAGCNTGVPNSTLPTACTISDLLSECAENAATHDDYTQCVTQTTNQLKRDGVITNKQKTDIMQCAATAPIP